MRTKSVKTGHENTKYTHFVVAAGRIFSGWEFAEDAKDDVANARAVTTVGAKVYTRRGLGTVGLDASKPECWYRAAPVEPIDLSQLDAAHAALMAELDQEEALAGGVNPIQK